MNIKKYIFYFNLLFWVVTCSAYASYANYDIGDDTGKDDTQAYYLYDDIDLISTLKYQYEKPKIVIQSVYPQLESDLDQESENMARFNQLIRHFITEEIIQFKKQVTVSNTSLSHEIKKTKNTLYIDYNASMIHPAKDHLLSIRFSIQGMIGGMAHPFHHHRTFTYNLDQGKFIELNDLFVKGANYLSVLSETSRAILSKHFANTSNASLINSIIITGTAPTAENYQNWNLNPRGLLITFDEAQVAPYVYGAQTVFIPYKNLKSIVGSDSPIANCVLHTKSCLRGRRLLTGGFIDEALLFNSPHGIFNPKLSHV